MMLFVTSLLLAGVVMTQADQMVDDLTVKPLSELLYVFDIKTAASVSEIKNALEDVEIRHAFKVVGVKRYYFVVASNNNDALRDLEFPEGSVVEQFPSGHIGDFYRMFNVTNKEFAETYDAEGIFDRRPIAALYWELRFPGDVTADEYGARMKALGEKFIQFQGTVKPTTYSAVGTAPARFHFFLALEDNVLDTVTKDTLDILGGPGRLYAEYRHVVRI